MPISAALFDFGGVLSTSPFQAFARYEVERGLPAGFIRQVNATHPETNAWARHERNEIGFDEFCAAFEAEAAAAGQRVDAGEVMALLAGDLRPEMLTAVHRCHEHLATALLTNNVVSMTESDGGMLTAVDGLFDVVVESSRVGVRKPDPRFYELACTQLGITPEEAVFLDDLGVNLKPARALGMITIKVVDPDQAIADLERVVGFPLR
ncbi:HAD-IA family hydrolase [soil metagenome]